jgi:AraC family transcriptional regulator
MESRIEILPEKRFIGKKIRMSFLNNKTYELWKSFMPYRKQITNNIGSELYSIEVYEPLYFNKFDPGKEFEKWAAVEVTSHCMVPEGLETLATYGGLYAVFLHHGPASEGPKTYQYIFETWLPHSDYLIDDRPHFAVMGEKYKNEDLNSEEEIWIPVKPKNDSRFNLT